MNRLILLLVWVMVISMSACPVHAQSAWQWLYPAPQGNTLRDIGVIGSSTAIAVGDLGTIVKSGDRGATWSVSPNLPTLPYLLGVSFVDATTVVAVAVNGAIFRSTDGGENWSPQASPTTNTLNDVDFADALNGSAVGSNGTILRSSDGGVTWTVQTSGTTETLYGVSAVDANTTTAVGTNGTILRTTNGGTTWTAQTSGTTVRLYGVDFVSSSTGTAVGDGPTALGTTDGGTTWLSQALPPVSLPEVVSLRSVSLSDGMHGSAAGILENINFGTREGIIYRTADGGASWSEESGPNELFGVAMFDNTEGLAVGGAGIIQRTTDGGLTWPQVAGGLQNYNMSAVDFVDPQHGVAASIETFPSVPPSPSSRTYATSDGGMTWTIMVQGWYIFNDVTFADATTVYAVGNGPAVMDAGGTMWRSLDGGLTWSTFFSVCCPPCSPTCFQTLRAVDFVGPNDGVAVGTEGAVVEVIGGVATWVSSPTIEVLKGVSVPTTQTAYAVGNNGVILKGDLTTSTWVQLTSGTSLPLNDVCFTDASTGTVVGNQGLILRTTDGGATWTAQASGTTAILTSVSFLDAANGIIGAGTTLLKTINGGNTWIAETTPSPMVDVVYIDPANVAAVGGKENIIARLDIPVPVFFQDFVAQARSHSVELRWAVTADEAIRGFRLYRNDGRAGEIDVAGAMIAPSERAFVDERVAKGVRYQYTLAAISMDGSETRSQPTWVELPRAAATLFQNHPNPFNPTTRIRFVVPAEMPVRLSVFDTAGRRIATLVDGIREVGEHTVTWDGKNSTGVPASSGIYLYELWTPDRVLARKMLLLK